MWSEYVHLASKDQRKVAKPSEGKAAVPARKASPSIMKNMVIGFGASLNGYQTMLWCAFLRLTPCDQVRARTSNRVFYDICDKRGKDEADE